MADVGPTDRTGSGLIKRTSFMGADQRAPGVREALTHGTAGEHGDVCECFVCLIVIVHFEQAMFQ